MQEPPVKTIKPLWSHQKKAVEKLKSRSAYALFMEPGTGKTRVAIEFLKMVGKPHSRGIPRTLIVAPPIVLKQWKSEITENSDIPPGRVHILSGPGKKRVALFNAMTTAYNYEEGGIYLTNYESLLMEELFNLIMLWKPQLIILDESHRIKTHSAKRTKQALRLGKVAFHKLILTGSPILNSIEDIWAQMAFLSDNILGGNFYAFRHKYMADRNRNMPRHIHFPDWQPKDGAEDAIKYLIKEHSFTARKSECLDLPPFITKRIEVEMGSEQKRAYNEMEKEFITFINQDTVVAELAITKTIRMRQILAGFYKNTNGVDIAFHDIPKLEGLVDLLQDLCPKEKVIVWTDFKHSYNLIAGKTLNLGFDYRMLTGEQTQKEKDAAVADFRKKDSVRVLIANPAAGGVGVNLVEASNMIYYSRSPSLEHDIQSEARAYRGGSERHKSVTRWDLVVPGTLDEVILEALKNKEDIGNAVLGWATKSKK